MGVALPPRIYDTNWAANRKSKIADFQNRVFQQDRSPAAAQRVSREGLESATSGRCKVQLNSMTTHYSCTQETDKNSVLGGATNGSIIQVASPARKHGEC